MPQYRKKPVVIEAAQWFRHGDDADVSRLTLSEWTQEHAQCCVDDACDQCHTSVAELHGWIGTLEGGHRVCPGDWIITGVKGERYPCKPDVFAISYEVADGAISDDLCMVALRESSAQCGESFDELWAPLDEQARTELMDQCRAVLAEVIKCAARSEAAPQEGSP